MAGTTRTITTDVIINGVDHLSGPVGRGVAKSLSSLDSFGTRMRGIAYGAFQVGSTFGIMAAGLAAPLIYATKQAVLFEDKMADVAKVADVKIGSAQFETLSEEAKDLSIHLGKSAIESAGLMASLASGGVATKDLKEVGTIAGEIAVAFELGAEQVGDYFSRIKNVLGLTVAETRLVADAVNVVSNETSSKAADILEFLAAGGAGVARSFGVSGKDIAAFGGVLQSNIVPSGAEAATVMERFSKSITKSATLTKIFNEAGRGTAGFLAIMRKGLAAGGPDQVNKFFAGFGEYGNQIRALALGMDGEKGLVAALKSVSDETKIAGSSHEEFAAKMSVTMGKLQVFWSKVQVGIINFGEKALPILQQVIADMSPFIERLGAWIEKNPELTAGIIKTTIGLVAFTGAVSVASFIIGGFATSFRAAAAVVGAFQAGGALAFVTKGIIGIGTAARGTAIGVALLSTPVLVTAGAFVALGAGIALAYAKIEPFQKAVDRLFAGIDSFTDHFPGFLSAVFTLDFDRAGAISKAADLQTELNSGKAMLDFSTGSATDYTAGSPKTFQDYSQYKTRGVTQNPVLSKDYLNQIQAKRDLPPTFSPSPYSSNPSSMYYSPTLNINVPEGAKDIKEVMTDILNNDKQKFRILMKDYQGDKERKGF